MAEKSLQDIEVLDEVAKYYGMSRPHGLGSSGVLSILHQGPENIAVFRAGGTYHTNGGVSVREPQALEPTRAVRVTSWLKSLIQS